MFGLTRAAVAATIFTLCGLTQSAAQADPDRAVAGGGALPPGWHARTDGNRPLTNVKFVPMSVGYHATLGPAAIFWRDADTASAGYGVEAKFWWFPDTSVSHRGHREGYGLFVGGSDLGGARQRYIYFLIRGDGTFLVKRRIGDSTAVVTPTWTPSKAVVKQDSGAAASPVENTLAIRVAGTKASFLVNGTEVYAADAGDLDAKGIVGYRVNHNLNVHLGPLAITR